MLPMCATCSGQFSAAAAAAVCLVLPDYAIIGNHFHARLEQRAAIWPRGSMPPPACPQPASLGHLGTWLFVFQRKGKLHKSEQLNFFRAANNKKISARSTHKRDAALRLEIATN